MAKVTFEQVEPYLNTHDQWTLDTNMDKLQIFRANLSEQYPTSSGIEAIKVVAHVPEHFEDIHIVTKDVSYRKVLNEKCIEAKFLEDNHDKDVIYVQMKTGVFMVSNRDMVIGRQFKKTANKYTWIMQSVPHSKEPERSGVVRANVVVQACTIEPHPSNANHTQFTFINLIDLNGWIPAAVVAAFTRGMPQEFANRLEHASKVLKEKKKKGEL